MDARALTTVYDASTGKLSESYRRAVAAALPDGIEPPDAFWRDLTAAVAAYFVLVENRTRRQRQGDLKRMQTIAALIDDLDKEVSATHRPALSQWGAISGRLLSTLSPAKGFAESYIIGHQAINPAFRGRNNPHRQYLYDAVLDLWRGLGQEVRSSTPEKPSGPLVSFFGACVGPILGDDAPTAHGIATIIKRARRLSSLRK